MIDSSLIETACKRLAIRTSALCALTYSAPLQKSYSFEEIRNGISLEKLKEDLAVKTGTLALYALAVDQEVAQSVVEAFLAAKANTQRGYSLPRFNGGEARSSLYVGSSLSIAQRLRQHLYLAPMATYALNMGRWCPSKNGAVHVAVQCICGSAERETAQDVEDVLWLANNPMFGRLGPR